MPQRIIRAADAQSFEIQDLCPADTRFKVLMFVGETSSDADVQRIETFLDKYPEYQGKVVLIQVALQTTEENEMQGGVADVVSHLNSRFSTLTYQPVVFLHTQDLTFSQYLALLTVANVFMVASLREGMALRAHESVEYREWRVAPDEQRGEQHRCVAISWVRHPSCCSP